VVITKLHQEIVRILKLQDVRSKITGGGGTVVGSTPEEFSAVIHADITKWKILVSKVSIKAE